MHQGEGREGGGAGMTNLGVLAPHGQQADSLKRCPQTPQPCAGACDPAPQPGVEGRQREKSAPVLEMGCSRSHVFLVIPKCWAPSLPAGGLQCAWVSLSVSKEFPFPQLDSRAHKI